MDGSRFETLTQTVFKPFLDQLGFAMQPVQANGRYYLAKFIGVSDVLCVSYEPGDEYVAGSIVAADQHETPISELNARYMGLITAAQILENEDWFRPLTPKDVAERKLIKIAKDLRLVLPQHLSTVP